MTNGLPPRLNVPGTTGLTLGIGLPSTSALPESIRLPSYQVFTGGRKSGKDSSGSSKVNSSPNLGG
ncbi:MAG: hypothetical protein K6T83_00520 [Alicyclobacillus sp.]|nr:hypothetical protein [Alicyclobacillus sp.]